MTNNSQPKEIQDKIDRIQKEMLDRTNMTENEAYDFAFKCWQCGLDFTKDLEKENQELVEIMQLSNEYLAGVEHMKADLIDENKEIENLKKLIQDNPYKKAIEILKKS